MKPERTPSPLDMLDPDEPALPASAAHVAGLLDMRHPSRHVTTKELEAAYLAAEALAQPLTIECSQEVLSQLAIGAAVATRNGHDVAGVGIRQDRKHGCTLELLYTPRAGTPPRILH